MNDSYDTWRSANIQFGECDYVYMTRPGFSGWESVSTSIQLLTEYVPLAGWKKILVFPCAQGILGPFIRDMTPQSQVQLMDTNVVAQESARRTCAENGLDPSCVHSGLPEPGQEDTLFDTILMPMPKGRALGRLYLLHAVLALRPHGCLYLAGGNKEGIKALIKDGEALFGHSVLMGYRQGHRVARFERPEVMVPLPAPFRQEGMWPGSYHTYETHHEGEDYVIATRPGVFSWNHLDKGTELLLSALEVGAGQRILDLGCGSGVIGMIAASVSPQGSALLVDVDSLAIDCARQTLDRNGVTNAEATLADGGTLAQRDFDLVVTNPPFHSGHEVSLDVVHSFISRAADYLQPGGRLILVANRFLRYDRAMSEPFRAVTTLVSNRSFHVLEGRR